MKKDIYIFHDGTLKRKDNTICFESKEGKKYIPVEETNCIWVFGEVSFNKRFLEFASKKELCLHFFSYYDKYIGTFYPREHLNTGKIILKQAENYLDYERRLYIASKIIIAAANNMIIVMKYYNNRDIGVYDNINNIKDKIDKLEGCKKIEELMAVEGNIRECYYKSFSKIIKNTAFEFKLRSKRPPLDKINALISFGNSLMYSTVLSEIYQTQLDPRIGYLHSTNMRGFTLNLDIAEIFKPIMVDRVIFSLLNKNIIRADDFTQKENGVFLDEEGKKKFLKEYNDKLASTIKLDNLNKYITYKGLIKNEIYKLQKHILGEKQYEGFIMRW